MKKTKTNKIAAFNFINIISEPWYWIANALGIVLIIAYQKAINILQNNGTNYMYILDILSVAIMFGLFLIHVNSISKNVLEEKVLKLNESLFYGYSSVRLLKAKIAGYIIAAFVQIVIFTSAMIISAEIINNSVIDYKIIGIVIVAIIVGLFGYLLLFSAMVAYANKSSTISQLTYPGTIVMLAAFILTIGFLEYPRKYLFRSLMFIPFVSPCIAAACAFEKLPMVNTYLEIVLYLVLAIAQTAIIAKICFKAYENGLKRQT